VSTLIVKKITLRVKSDALYIFTLRVNSIWMTFQSAYLSLLVLLTCSHLFSWCPRRGLPDFQKVRCSEGPMYRSHPRSQSRSHLRSRSRSKSRTHPRSKSMSHPRSHIMSPLRSHSMSKSRSHQGHIQGHM